MFLSLILSLSVFLPGLLADPPPPIPTYLMLGNPTFEGVRVRITKPGLDLVTQTAGRIADFLVPTTAVADRTGKITGVGWIEVKNVKLSNFKTADSYSLDLIPIKQLKVTAKNISFDTNFDYHLKGSVSVPFAAIPIESTGVGSAKVRRLDIFPLLSILKDPKDQIELKVDSCTGTFGSLDVTMKDNNATDKASLNQEKTSQDVTVDSICDEISKVVREKVNRNLESLAKVTPLKLDDSGGKNNKIEDEAEEDKIIKRLMEKVKTDTSKLFLDYRLLKDPLVIPPYVETFHKGEISWQKEGKTPFYPIYMPPIDASGNRMLYLQISDYTLNSLIYHAYDHQILSLTADEKATPYLKEVLTTTCPKKEDLFCFGNSFESVAKSYPNHKIQLKTYPIQPPYINVTAGKGLVQEILGKLEIYARPPDGKPQFTLFKSDYSMLVEVIPKIVAGKLHGNVSISHVKVKVVESPADKKTQEDFSNEAEFAIGLIAEKLDGLLRKGVELPQIGFASLVRPITKFLDRIILVESDFKLNEEKLKSDTKNESH